MHGRYEMRNTRMLLSLATALSAAALGYAQPGEIRADDFEISRWTIDGARDLERIHIEAPGRSASPTPALCPVAKANSS